ncbi:MAG TPA: metal-dependent hydrolase [Vicinamibacterales bacterium]|jgi:L-ascorbate metabolism protein UlaG (beta-lactamase superfamily)|nr:metal-dependent hydrolase [Vicinamibacterales bacterium]
MSLSISYLGHSAFLLTLPTGQRLAFDPWIGNPKCPSKFAKPEALGKLDLILLSHGHDDHASDVPAIARASGAPVACLFELGLYLRERGVADVRDMGIGGTQEIAGVSVTMTQAVHTGSTVERGRIMYLGGAAGFIVRTPQAPTIYFAGDTALFGDMKLIGEIYRPDIAFLPIGDRYTMGPDTAATAARWLGVRQVVPMHWGTFPLLTGTPAALVQHLAGSGIEVLALEPGETAE